MIRHSRRRFIGQLFAMSIGSGVLSCTAGHANDDLNDGLAELCVITRQPGHLPKGIVDVWAGQIGYLDLVRLPKQYGRVVVWHDIHNVEGLSRSVGDILFATEEYFGVKPVLGSNAAAHVGSPIGLSSSIEALFKSPEPGCFSPIGHRIAVIDLESCGLTRLHWLDIIPLLRRYYTHVVGVDYSFPDLCELDSEFEPPHGLSEHARNTLRACDYWLLASDESLSGQAELSIEERSTELTRSIHDLCDALASPGDDIDSAISGLAMRRFAMFGARA
ncbi:MAG: hypothetical protein ACREDL_22715 [Bradyrhizobium sp.]